MLGVARRGERRMKLILDNVDDMYESSKETSIHRQMSRSWKQKIHPWL